ncbi:MAG: protease inhibitor I42 family protein [Candidatus Omnitrophica bacterium]|nr:protease inhibitor I42 family protein [Candidatus Omnitrophota bacterium]
MQELFNLGYQEASQGYPWKKLPPGLRGINEPQKFNDPSEVIKVVVGERFLITLESNKTTGYEWQLVNPLDSNALQIVSSGYIPGDSKLMGAAGKEEWSFLALKPVKANIYFKYVRSWEKGIAPAKEATFTVLIDK